MIRVRSAGFGTRVQDCGRPGFRKYGVATGGALDQAALRVLNLLVGNRENAAGLELVNGHVRLEFTDERLLAWSGGDFEVRIDGAGVPALHCARVGAGEKCEMMARRGRAWLAVSGGIDVPLVLGSRSTDVRARFGGMNGRALRDDELPLGTNSEIAHEIEKTIAARVSSWSAPPNFMSFRAKQSGVEESLAISREAASRRTSNRLATALRIVPGKDWSDKAGATLLRGGFRIAINSDRSGLRLEGDAIPHNIGELVSEAVTPGTIQLPPDGAPILLLADCQTIGGYPRLAHVITVDLARAAQLQPLDEVRFDLTNIQHARELLRQRERDIALFGAGIQARFG